MRQKWSVLMVVQIFHAGNKALPSLTPNGEVVSLVL